MIPNRDIEMFESSNYAKRTVNPIRGIVDKLKVTNTEKTLLSLALGNFCIQVYFLTNLNKGTLPYLVIWTAMKR